MLNAAQTELLNEIIIFGKNRNFDFQNMTKETLDSLMKEWLKAGLDFQKRVSELEISVLKNIFKIN